MMPCEMPCEMYIGTMLIFCAMPMAATGLAPKLAVKLVSRVMPVTLSRFWIDAGMPTPQTPTTTCRRSLNALGRMQT